MCSLQSCPLRAATTKEARYFAKLGPRVANQGRAALLANAVQARPCGRRPWTTTLFRASFSGCFVRATRRSSGAAIHMTTVPHRTLPTLRLADRSTKRYACEGLPSRLGNPRELTWRASSCCRGGARGTETLARRSAAMSRGGMPVGRRASSGFWCAAHTLPTSDSEQQFEKSSLRRVAARTTILRPL